MEWMMVLPWWLRDTYRESEKNPTDYPACHLISLLPLWHDQRGRFFRYTLAQPPLLSKSPPYDNTTPSPIPWKLTLLFILALVSVTSIAKISSQWQYNFQSDSLVTYTAFHSGASFWNTKNGLIHSLLFIFTVRSILLLIYSLVPICGATQLFLFIAIGSFDQSCVLFYFSLSSIAIYIAPLFFGAVNENRRHWPWCLLLRSNLMHNSEGVLLSVKMSLNCNLVKQRWTWKDMNILPMLY